MQAYYQAERAMPPVDKNVTSPVQAMMMMTSTGRHQTGERRRNKRGLRTYEVRQIGREIIEDLFLASLVTPAYKPTKWKWRSV